MMTIEMIQEELESVKKKMINLEQSNMTHNQKIFLLEDENLSLKKELHAMDKKVFNCEKETGKSSNMIVSRLRSLQVEIRALRSEMKEVQNRQGDVERKYELLEGLKKSLNRILVPVQKMTELEKQMQSFDGITDRIEKMEMLSFSAEDDSKSLHDSLLDGQQMMSALQKKMSTINIRLMNVEQKLCDVSCNLSTNVLFDTILNASQDINERRMLDICRYNAPSSSPFDSTSCVLDPPEEGHYVLTTRLGQYGIGEISVYFKLEGMETVDYLGKTHGDNDVLNCFKVWKLRRGQKVWMEAQRTKDSCRIGFCSFSGWLLSKEN